MSHFWTADQHFGWRNIRIKCNRPWGSLEDMDAALINAWNKRVGPKDTVHHLGDFARRNFAEYRARLNGRIILYIGNHDYDHEKKLRACMEEVHHVKFIKYGGREIWLSHYAHRVWPKQHYGAWHLFGHSHGKLNNQIWPGSMDVGVDTHPDFAPYSWDEIVAKLTPLSGSPKRDLFFPENIP